MTRHMEEKRRDSHRLPFPSRISSSAPLSAGTPAGEAVVTLPADTEGLQGWFALNEVRL